MNYRNIGITVFVALVVALVVTYFAPTPTQRIVERVVEKTLGSVSGPDILFPTLSFNGVRYHYRNVPFTTGTTTVCSVAVPRYNEASTSLVQASFSVYGVPTTTTGSVWRVYTGLGQTSTTTFLPSFGSTAITATGTAVFATTTGASYVMSNAQQYVILDFQGGSTPYIGQSGGRDVRTGQCNFVFMEL